MLRHSLSLIALAALPAMAIAQGSVDGHSPNDSLYRKAQSLVMNGNGADGRAIVDSLMAVATPGSNDYAEALYWKAALADNAAEAERGYLRLTIEYPLSPRSESALLRLGQLELTRGNRQVALSRFERAAREFPYSAQRARTEYTIGRVYLEDRRMAEGCMALQNAREYLSESDIELRNQVDYLSRQCVGVALDGTQASPASPAAGARPAVPAAVTPTPASPEPVRRPAVQRPAPAAPAPAPPPAAPPVTEKEPAARPPAARPPTATTLPAARSGWSVQVAAFDRDAPARELADQLRREGFDARVDVDEKWRRVRIGHFPTREAAAAEARALKARGITGFVTGVGGGE